MAVVVSALVGLICGRAIWLAMSKTWSTDSLLKENYLRAKIPTAVGIVLFLSLAVVEALRMVFAQIGIGTDPGLAPVRAAMFVAVAGFALLGLVDDLVGSSVKRGFKGHINAMLGGKLTTGGIKMLFGFAVAVIAAGLMGQNSAGELLVAAAVIALSANLINLLDTRPGRAGKVGLFLMLITIIAGRFDATLAPVALVAGSMIALLFDDLRGRLMIGDTGANALGAAVGVALVSYSSGSGTVVILIALAFVNLLSEFVSFSKVIDKFPPFRVLDEFGRRLPPVIDVRDGSTRASENSDHVRSGSSSMRNRPGLTRPTFRTGVRSSASKSIYEKTSNRDRNRKDDYFDLEDDDQI